MPHRQLPIVGVMGASAHEHADLAEPLGRMIASLPVHLLTGSGPGVMTAVARAFTSVEDRVGLSIGIVPAAAIEAPTVARKGYPNPFIEVPIRTHLIAKQPGLWDGLTRNHINILTADAIVALPGATGTAHEIKLACDYEKPIATWFHEADEMNHMPAHVRRCADLEAVKAFLAETLDLGAPTGKAKAKRARET